MEKADSGKANTLVQKDYSGSYNLPSLKTRYISTLIDFMVILGLSMLMAFLFEKIGYVHDAFRITGFVLIFVLYEPLFVSTLCTPGQFLMNIRVRQINNPEKKLSFFNAFLRIIIKGILGWLSFITIGFNPNRRAIHDFSSRSIVVVPATIAIETQAFINSPL